MADSTGACNQTSKNTPNSLSITDDPLEDQTKLELKNKSSLEREISQTVSSQISKDGPCLQISNHLTKEKTKTCIKSASDSISSPNPKLNGINHESHMESHFLTPSGSPLTNNADVDPSNASLTSYPFSSSKIRSISNPAYSFTSSPVGSSHLKHPYSAPLPVSKGSDLPRIIKHKPSSITFADYNDFLGLIQNSRATESSDAFETSSEDEGQDVVFHDGNEVLPKCKELQACSRRNRAGLEKLRRKGTCGQGVGEERSGSKPPLTSSSSYEAEEESSSTEESPQVVSPWSESMIQLMKRLDQLNLDIEEALSAGSSPSDTPSPARRYTANDRTALQSGAVEGNQSINWINMARRSDTRERQSLERHAGATSSMGRSHARKTEMSIKKRHGGAGEDTFTFMYQTVLVVRRV